MAEYAYDPVCFWHGDTAVFRAGVIELMVRKGLDTYGYKQADFKESLSGMIDLDYNNDVEVEGVYSYLEKLFAFIGYTIIIPENLFEFDEEELEYVLQIEMPLLLNKLDGYEFKKYSKKWEKLMDKFRFYGTIYNAEFKEFEGKRGLFLKVADQLEVYYNWMGIADLFYNFLVVEHEIKEVLEHGNLNSLIGRKSA